VEVLRIASGTVAADLDVIFTPSSLQVINVSKGINHLSGDLASLIVPDDSVWDYDGEVLTIYLHKANLELYAAPACHSLTEWKALFADGFQIKWDDVAKDYSDLPRHSMDLFKQSEIEKDETRRIASDAESLRDKTVETDELRRRERQVRLAVLRGSDYVDWIEMTRRSPVSDSFMG